MSQIISKYTVQNENIDNYTNALVISDVHDNVKAFKDTVEFVEAYKPDMIFMPGDIIDSVDNNHKELYKLIKRLCDYSRLYVSLGNHDTVSFTKENGKRREVPTDNYIFFEKLKDICEVFINKVEGVNAGNNIVIHGVNPSVEWYQNGENKEEFQKLMSDYSFDEKSFNLLLSHTPNGFMVDGKLICDPNIDLILSGHNHGGMVPQRIQDILKNGIGLFGPYAKVLFPNAYGYYSNENTSLIISNGITKVAASNEVAFLAKILNYFYPPNMELISFLPSDKNKTSLDYRIKIK